MPTLKTKHRQILRRIRKTYCRIRRSQIEGVGIVAVRDIPANTNPFYGIYPQKWYRIPVSQIREYDAELYKMIDDFYVIETDGTAWVPEHALNGMDISFFLNHSDTPNIQTRDGEHFVTTRAIKKGEELSIGYETYDHKYRKKSSSGTG